MGLEDSSHSSYVGKTQRQVTTVTSVMMFAVHYSHDSVTISADGFVAFIFWTKIKMYGFLDEINGSKQSDHPLPHCSSNIYRYWIYIYI